MRADLHVHSTASDGSLSPRQLVQAALDAGLTHLAITDHDSVEGLPEALAAARGTDLTVIAAVELSALEADGSDVHIIGFGVDPSDIHFLAALAHMREARLERAAAMVDSLAAAGLRVSLNDVLDLSLGGSIGRSHVARALFAAGHVESVSGAFDHLIGRGRPHYIPKESRDARQAIGLIRSAGGLPVIAHPGVNGLAELVVELTTDGLSGVEAYHADHTTAQRTLYSDLAKEHGLLITGGSDFHTPEGPNPPLGSVDYPVSALKALLATLDAR